VANWEKIVLSDILSDGDVSGEIEMNQKWEEFIDLQQVGIGHHLNVEDECELQGDWVEKV
jgi:hypothetical protein